MPNYEKKYIRPANMLLCLRDELNSVFPGRYTGTDGFVSGYGIYGTSAHNANDKGHCMAFDFSTTVDQMIDEPTGRALTDYLRTKKNEFYSYLIHDMGPVAAEPRIAGNRTGWKWAEYDGPQHADHTHLSLTEDYKWGDSCGLAQSIYDRTVYWGIKEWYESYKNGTSKDEFDMASVGDVVKALLDHPIDRKGAGQSGKTTLRNVLAYSDFNFENTIPVHTADAILDERIGRRGEGAKDATTLRTVLAFSDSNLNKIPTPLEARLKAIESKLP